jgi:hypothetical protein
MVGRYLKSLLLVLMCGGLVGPLFLIIYFVFETPFDRQATGWMYIAGLVITVIDVLIAIAVANGSAKSAAKRADLERNGVLALAQITGMKGTGMEINDQPVVKLDLHITGPGVAFDTQKRVTASVIRMATLNARKLVVLVDPATNDYEVDWQRSELVNGLMPAQFTLADDNKSYDLSGQAEPLMEILRILKANGIPLTSPLDLRSADQALRRQLQDVVRRAATATAAAAAAAQQSPAFAAQLEMMADSPGFTTAKPSTAQRLQELATLHANEAITDEEYAEQRRQIISEI